jgi:glutamate synthase (NADPH/NADH) small chain
LNIEEKEMGDVTGFLKIKRKEAGNRPVVERICDFSEVEQILNSEDRMLQAARCMDCGVPFCHWGCPVDNLIPEWNDLLFKGDWKGAYQRLGATNNFPEFTGRICPAPCEHGCVLNIHLEPVTIRENEVAIAEKAFSEGYIKPVPPPCRTGKKVAIIGSGPSGMAAADLLNKAGHEVTLFEKEARAGGLLRYGVPDFKLSKATIDRRLEIMVKEGLTIRTNVNIGVDIPIRDIVNQYDAVCVATGASRPRDLMVEGRDLNGIHFALDFLVSQNKINGGESAGTTGPVNAKEKKVVVIGGGDTGSDCVGTAIRQKASGIIQVEILPRPPMVRNPDNPWPFYARVMKTSTSHEEGCERIWSLSTVRFIGNEGNVTGVEVEDVEWMKEESGYSMKIIAGTRRIIDTDLVLLALGFVHPAQYSLIKDVNADPDDRDKIKTGKGHTTGINKVFVAGDALNGASLVVYAIASGRSAAREIDRFLRR